MKCAVFFNSETSRALKSKMMEEEHDSVGVGCTRNLCQICSISKSKYVCPRCNMFYCSVKCYQSEVHAHCSEEFYKECVMNQLKSIEPLNDSQTKMIDALKRLNELESDCCLVDEDNSVGELDSDDDMASNDDFNDLSDRLKGIDLDDSEQVWSKLTDEERKEFEKLLESGDVVSILPKFEPWWNYRDDRKVVDLEEESHFDRIHKCNCPKIDKNIIQFSTLVSNMSSPSPVICYNLINILGAYSFIARYYNGDHQEYGYEATVILITVSKNLSSNQNFTDFDSALASVFLEMSNCSSLKIEDVGNISDEIKKDVMNIIRGPDINYPKFYILAALSDVRSLFLKCVKTFVKNSTSSSSTCGEQNSTRFSKTKLSSPSSLIASDIGTNMPMTKLKVKNCIKKIEYLQSWVTEFYKLLPHALH